MSKRRALFHSHCAAALRLHAAPAGPSVPALKESGNQEATRQPQGAAHDMPQICWRKASPALLSRPAAESTGASDALWGPRSAASCCRERSSSSRVPFRRKSTLYISSSSLYCPAASLSYSLVLCSNAALLSSSLSSAVCASTDCQIGSKLRHLCA